MPFLEVDALAAMLCLDIDEADVMCLGHRVRLLSDLDLQLLVVALNYDWQVVLVLAFRGVRTEFLHLFTTAYWHWASIDHLGDEVATGVALIKFRFHTLCCLRFKILPFGDAKIGQKSHRNEECVWKDEIEKEAFLIKSATKHWPSTDSHE